MKTMKHIKTILAVAVIIFTASCGKEEPVIEEAPHWVAVSPQSTGTPDWTVTAEPDLNSTMTIIAAAENTGEEDLFAVFSYGECIAKTSPIETPVYGLRFYTNIYMPKVANAPLTLAYYSATDKRTYYWPNEMFYEHDGVLGLASSPYLLDVSTAMPYLYSVTAYLNLSAVELSAGDELAGFVGDECRCVFPVQQYLSNPKEQQSIRIPMKEEVGKFYFRYYNAKEGKILRSEDFDIKVEDGIASITVSFK